MRVRWLNDWWTTGRIVVSRLGDIVLVDLLTGGGRVGERAYCYGVDLGR